MNLPILGKLKDGVKFDFSTLVDNIEQTDEFLKWWWSEKANLDQISRPELISDDDPVLTETISKDKVDLAANRDLFDRFLFQLTQTGALPTTACFGRSSFHDQLLRIVGSHSAPSLGRPQIVFAGGGYGSGKTTVLNRLAECNDLPVGVAHLVGVDIFKTLIPEYNLIKAVADGRASLTVQKECVKLADRLFDTMVQGRRSFIWDSSMSNKNETLARIEKVKHAGYHLSLVAVFTPLETCIRQAMHRAQYSRRFPNPEALPKSHPAFLQAFMQYTEHFGEITVFANIPELNDTIVVAEKKKAGKGLEILEARWFNFFINRA